MWIISKEFHSIYQILMKTIMFWYYVTNCGQSENKTDKGFTFEELTTQ